MVDFASSGVQLTKLDGVGRSYRPSISGKAPTVEMQRWLAVFGRDALYPAWAWVGHLDNTDCEREYAEAN